MVTRDATNRTVFLSQAANKIGHILFTMRMIGRSLEDTLNQESHPQNI